MVRKIGNIITIMVWCSLLHADASISMRLLDYNGQPVKQVAVGVPFSVEVTVSNQNGRIETPHVAGLQAFVVEDKTHVSTINSVINGVQTTKKIFQFRMHADKQGTYTIGPAYCIADNQRNQSNTLAVVVGPHAITGSEQPHMRIFADKNRMFLGEKVVITLRLYPGKSSSLEGISEPNFSGLSAGPLEGPFTGAEDVDGVQCSYLEWRSVAYPDKAGAITIPAVAAVCRIERTSPARFDIFDHFFDSGLEHKQVYSNALTLNVDELPSHTGKVHGVGTFTHLKAELDHEAAQEGEGIVLRLILEGEGNFAAIEPIELLLPEGLKYYDSKHYMHDDTKKSATQRKVFEYIVQGIKPGTWIIPPQTFTYFKVQDRMYKQLKSNQLQVTITPLAKVQSGPDTRDTTKSIVQNLDQDIAPLEYDDRLLHAQQERMVSWFWFFLVLFIPCVLVATMYLQRSIKQYRYNNAAQISAKHAFKQARAALKKAHGDSAIFYDIFVKLIAQRCMVEVPHVSSEFIIQRLQQAGCSQEVIMAWQRFFNELLPCKFARVIHDQKKVQVLLTQAGSWLDELQKIL